MSDSQDPKKFLNETLPSPEPTPESDPRARVVARLRRLMRGPAGIGAVVAMSCVACDPVAQPYDATLDANDSGPQPDTDATADAGIDAGLDGGDASSPTDGAGQ